MEKRGPGGCDGLSHALSLLFSLGLQHQGIFRVSGSQVEVNDIKNSFERGENPLADDQSNRDINSVAGVLKLYFRGLENPLFPKERFNDLISCVSKWAVSFFSPLNFFPTRVI